MPPPVPGCCLTFLHTSFRSSLFRKYGTCCILCNPFDTRHLICEQKGKIFELHPHLLPMPAMHYSRTFRNIQLVRTPLGPRHFLLCVPVAPKHLLRSTPIYFMQKPLFLTFSISVLVLWVVTDLFGLLYRSLLCTVYWAFHTGNVTEHPE